ncbi:hypothetical protein ACFL1C_02895 [Pseudomonadota bacterium]
MLKKFGFKIIRVLDYDKENIRFPAGHFYSPLLDLSEVGPDELSIPYDDERGWEQLDLVHEKQRAYYKTLINDFPVIPFPETQTDG